MNEYGVERYTVFSHCALRECIWMAFAIVTNGNFSTEVIANWFNDSLSEYTHTPEHQWIFDCLWHAIECLPIHPNCGPGQIDAHAFKINSL